MTYTMRPSVRADALALAPHLRRADVAELDATGSNPAEALLLGYRHSNACLTVTGTDGTPSIMFGVVQVDSLSAAIWLLSDDRIEGELRRPFLKEAPETLDWFHRDYPVLFNEVWEGNTKHVRWLRWMGFTFINRRTTQKGHSFLQFTRLKHV